MTTIRTVNEMGTRQGANESITYTVTTTPWGSSPTSLVVAVTDRTNYTIATPLDVTATVMPTNSPSAVGDVITLSPLKLLTASHTYRVAVRFTVSGNVEECYFDVIGE